MVGTHPTSCWVRPSLIGISHREHDSILGLNLMRHKQHANDNRGHLKGCTRFCGRAHYCAPKHKLVRLCAHLDCLLCGLSRCSLRCGNLKGQSCFTNNKCCLMGNCPVGFSWSRKPLRYPYGECFDGEKGSCRREVEADLKLCGLTSL